MEDKLDKLYTAIIQSNRHANENKRRAFREWFTKNSMLKFIKTFFANDLNIDRTGNELFLARSTVRFRLNRIEEFTGCNIRKFKGALQLLNLLVSSGLI